MSDPLDETPDPFLGPDPDATQAPDDPLLADSGPHLTPPPAPGEESPAVEQPTQVAPAPPASAPAASAPAPSPAAPAAPPVPSRKTTRRRERTTEKVPTKKKGLDLQSLAIGGVIVVVLAVVVTMGVMTGQSGGQGKPAGGAAPKSGSGGTSSPSGSSGSSVPVRAGPSTCGYCNGDGRIDAADRDRRVPPFTNAPVGTCPYCGGK